MKQVTRHDAVVTTGAKAGGLPGLQVAGATAGVEVPATDAVPAPKRDWWVTEFRQMVTLGESTTAGGWSSHRERAWAHLVASMINDYQRIPVQLVNVGIGANLISPRSPAYEHSGKPAALLRLEPHVFKHEPDLLFVSYGLNDARGGTPLELFTEEMTKLIDLVRARIHPLIVLLGPYYVVGLDRYGPHFNKATLETLHDFNRAVGQMAQKKDCLFVDVLSGYHNTNWLIHSDGVHANDLGHRLVANKVFEILATNCSGLVKETLELEQYFPRWRDESVLRQQAGEE